MHEIRVPVVMEQKMAIRSESPNMKEFIERSNTMSKLINDTEYNNFNDLVKASGLTKEEIYEITLKNQIISELIKARQGKGLTQKELENVSGVKQPLIARIERGNVDPQITTLLRILLPLGLTLAIVPEKNQEI